MKVLFVLLQNFLSELKRFVFVILWIKALLRPFLLVCLDFDFDCFFSQDFAECEVHIVTELVVEKLSKARGETL